MCQVHGAWSFLKKAVKVLNPLKVVREIYYEYIDRGSNNKSKYSCQDTKTLHKHRVNVVIIIIL